MSYRDLYQEVRLFGGEKDGLVLTFTPSWQRVEVFYSPPLESSVAPKNFFTDTKHKSVPTEHPVLAYRYDKTKLSQKDNGELFYIHKYNREESLDKTA